MRARETIDRHSDLGPSSKDWQPGSVGRDEDFTPEKDLWTRAHKGGLGAGRPGEDVQGGRSAAGYGDDVQPGTRHEGRSWQSNRPTPDNKDEQLEEELEDTFPASDPPTVTQPGVTGWEPDEPAQGSRIPARRGSGYAAAYDQRFARRASLGWPWLALSLALLPALLFAGRALIRSRRSPPRRF